MENESFPRGVRTLDRAIVLMGAILDDQGRTPLSRIAAQLGLPPSSASRIVSLLVRHNVLARVGGGRYATGFRLAKIANPLAQGQALCAAVRPKLQSLAFESKTIAHLGVLDNDMVTYLVKADGSSAGLFTQEGMQLEAYCSAVGKVLLAYLPRTEIDAYLRAGPFVALTPNTITDPGALDCELALIRRRGFALDNREMADDLTCVAVPLTARNQVVAAISLSKRPAQDNLDGIVDLLRQTVALIERRLV